jgi:hypothetical protein
MPMLNVFPLEVHLMQYHVCISRSTSKVSPRAESAVTSVPVNANARHVAS